MRGLGRTRRCGATAAAFTLTELLIVVALLSVIAGVALVHYNGVQDQAEHGLSQVELNRLADAVRQFCLDMGEPPQFLCELMQSPDPDDAHHGWWWRDGGDYPLLDSEDEPLCAAYPAQGLWRYDPTTRRGWNGPYVEAECSSRWPQRPAVLAETIKTLDLREVRCVIIPDEDADVHDADDPHPPTVRWDEAVETDGRDETRRLYHLTLLSSQYSSCPQDYLADATDAERIVCVSNYELVYDYERQDIGVRMLTQALRDSDTEQAVRQRAQTPIAWTGQAPPQR
ncbi:MAG: prepilin-type N-terminal cleavage/methylation domain-containing protein [Planctomycetes bacterium]|nr:prepilin-type N-terminal cleavage/methylation domain-containing protein [Planctomycetota bacterium]